MQTPATAPPLVTEVTPLLLRPSFVQTILIKRQSQHDASHFIEEAISFMYVLGIIVLVLLFAFCHGNWPYWTVPILLVPATLVLCLFAFVMISYRESAGIATGLYGLWPYFVLLCTSLIAAEIILVIFQNYALIQLSWHLLCIPMHLLCLLLFAFLPSVALVQQKMALMWSIFWYAVCSASLTSLFVFGMRTYAVWIVLAPVAAIELVSLCMYIIVQIVALCYKTKARDSLHLVAIITLVPSLLIVQCEMCLHMFLGPFVIISLALPWSCLCLLLWVVTL